MHAKNGIHSKLRFEVEKKLARSPKSVLVITVSLLAHLKCKFESENLSRNLDQPILKRKSIKI